MKSNEHSLGSSTNAANRLKDTAVLCEKLFGGGEFRWGFGMRSEDAASFFAPQHDSGILLESKKHWLDSHPDLHLAETAHAAPLVDAVWELAIGWHHVQEPSNGRTLRRLAELWEPDILLVTRDTMSIAAGAVCFPSSWDLRDSIGKPLREIHDVVPQLNSQLGARIDRFLNALEVGRGFARVNWGITRSAEPNYHPALKRRRLDQTVCIDELHLRIEHQLFTAMRNGLLMGIRIESIPFTQLPLKPETWMAASKFIRTMPMEIAAYKGLDSALDTIADAMDQQANQGTHSGNRQ